MVSFINIGIVAFVLVGLGPFLEEIPSAILSAIIFVSLKKIFMQVRDFKNFWDISKIDGVSLFEELSHSLSQVLFKEESIFI